jgi:integrase
VEQDVNDYAQIITLETTLTDALRWAETRGHSKWTHRTQIDIESYMSSIYPAIQVLRYDGLALGEITYQHIDNILAQTFKTTTKYNAKKKKEVTISWSNYKKNRAKDYFSCYFGIMKEKKVIKENPCSGMKDLPWKKKKEDAYSTEELQEITRLLWEADADYATFILLFYDSSARETEFMKLRDTDVNLEKQTFKRDILKGLHNQDSDEEAPEGIISNAALPYWRKVLIQCQPGDYLFSRGFRPDPKPIRPDNINTRWREIVKPHFPESRPYLLKHTNLTNVTDQFGDNIAAAAAGHTTTEIIRKYYDKRRNQRTRDVLKTKSNLHLLGRPATELRQLPSCTNCVFVSAPNQLLPSKQAEVLG